MYNSKCIAKMKDDVTTTLDKSILQTEQLIYQKPLIKLFVDIIKIFALFF